MDWQNFGCEIAGSARNGKTALESIEALHPDIVICDINMPVLNGLEVLKAASEQICPPVFVMLTNLEDFDMARDAMRYQAVDYLLKTQLEPETLEKSLALAIEECKKRGKLARVNQADSYIEDNLSLVVADNIKRILNANNNAYPRDALEALRRHGAFSSYCFIQLMMDFSELPSLVTFSSEEKKRLFDWESEVVEKLASNVFKNFAMLDKDGYGQSLTLFCYQYEKNDIVDALERFYKKLENASANITQSRLALLATDVFSDEACISTAIAQYYALREYYALSSCALMLAQHLPKIKYEPFNINDISNRLIMELRAKNIAECQNLLSSAIARIEAAPHTQSDTLNACTELYSVAATVLTPLLPKGAAGDYWSNTAAVIHFIHRLATRDAALVWLRELSSQIIKCLEQVTSAKSDIVEKAKQYVHENADKRIMLQDVANYVNISPSYLSALFKKEYKANFIDYINQTKMERACELIREGKYRIYEISYMLSFENAYYFTKVFKRHTGLTPTEYQRQLRGEKSNE
ncbi:MAG: helix-turn-helix domain-containing protein [Oscillospiraceae bacterium]